MKNQLYIVLGYGVAKDIKTDVNNQLLLRTVFNSAYRSIVGAPGNIVVLSSGGPTDMFRPYRRTEAGEMTKEFRRMSTILPLTYRRHIRFLAETKSISTLENFLFTRRWIRPHQPVTLFGEMTRAARYKKMVRLVWGKSADVTVVGVDFDASANRYVDPTLLQQKERNAWQFDQWAMKSLAHRRRHHQLYEAKIKKLRELGPGDHVQAVRGWFDEAMKSFPAEIRRK